MIIDEVSQLTALPPRAAARSSSPYRRVLMVSPEHFRVDYAINPYMTDATGALNRVDGDKACRQWMILKACYEALGYPVVVLPADQALPDMVFAANQSFPYWDHGKNGPAVVLSRMRSAQRAPEVAHFAHWYSESGYSVRRLETTGSLEGNGDALIQPGTGWVWGGHGPRTDASVYQELSERFGFTVLRLALRDPNFYHLDTCFSILAENCVAIQPAAFDDRGLALIRAAFPRVIEIEYDECVGGFAGNCHSPDGRNVIVHPGNHRFTAALARNGFVAHEVDTSEFLKSGGSVFCLKMMIF